MDQSTSITSSREALRLLGCVGIDLDIVELSDGERIELIRALEDAKNTLTSVQARLAVTFDASQRADQAAHGMPVDRQGRGIGDQIGMARRQSPHAGSRFLTMAKVLTTVMPHTLLAMQAGVLDEQRAQVLVDETSCLSDADRVAVDLSVAGDQARLGRLGVKKLANLVRKEAYTRDPHAALERISKAEADRHVTLRPAPDCMTRLSALLPVAEGVAVYAALTREATAAHAVDGGDPRSSGQIMADTLVTRTTGQATADAVPVALHLVLPADTFLGQADQPGRIAGQTPIPAGLARRILRAAPQMGSFIKNLYTGPTVD